MNASEDARDEEMAPAVRSILAAARDRRVPEGSVSVDPRDIPVALARARSDGRRPVIAEVKPTSPTTDGVREDDPVELAESMVDGGAAALSVLTEPDHFGGSTEALRRVRETVDVPVLRKDFLLEEAQLDAVEADAVLLIARFLDDLEGMVRAARERGFDPLVEVHTREELDRALGAGADLVGVNNRDLAHLEVDLSTFESIAPRAPEDATLVAESGIGDPEDADRMLDAGADGLLVGSALMEGSVRENAARLTGVADR
ncbi:indole-3-glycerol phosphate synthase [Halobacteriales archaeon QS_8_69_26]|nr:MAG: indole-3-glycerol phosphate synthase [Halobacteriales archaeon QS_8_69_26]